MAGSAVAAVRIGGQCAPMFAGEIVTTPAELVAKL